MGEEQSKKCLAGCELPEHLAAEILPWLPVECLCRFRCVSKQWNALISSTKFITTKWAEVPPNRMPWLVVQAGKWPNCLAYCFFTRVWKKTSSLSMSFYDQVDFCGSSLGLILLKNNRERFIVCNPLTRTSLKLPSRSSMRTIRGRAIVAGEGDSPDTYKVVTLGLDYKEEGVVEIYDSTKKSWSIVPHRPHISDHILIADSQLVFFIGSFYYLSFLNGIWNIVGFGITDGTSISAPLPKIANRLTRCPTLVACGSHLLVEGEIIKSNTMQVITWEFERVNVNSSSSSLWKEIGRMPPSMCAGVKILRKKCPFPIKIGVGVEDCAYFMAHLGTGALKVVVYSISENTWSWLPSCPIQLRGAIDIMAFEPRPDMKVQ